MKQTRIQKSSEPRAKREKPAQPAGWAERSGLIFHNYESCHSDKVIGLDMDSTLIKTKSGKTFAVNPDDWEFLYPNVPAVLQDYCSRGFRAVIFTNQKGISTGQVDRAGFIRKVDNIVKALNIPVLALAATDDGPYRKPCTGMWELLCEQLNEGVPIDMSESLYVGDAAGRPPSGVRKKDFNDTDLKFALNLDLCFKTPEQLFLGQAEQIPQLAFNPKTIKNLESEETKKNYHRSSQEMIIFVGSPGSGKSTFWQNYLSNYTRVNNDTLKNKDRCLKVTRESLAAGKSCVVDNTNPSREARAPYLRLAQDFNVLARCFIFTVDKALALHLDTMRLVNSHREHLSKRVGRMPINTFFSRFEAPSESEGFSEVQDIELLGGPFANECDRKMFFSYVQS